MTECGKVINGVFTPCECGIINGVPTPCTRPNECCSNSFFYKNTCGLDYNFCSEFTTQENLCGPCTTEFCFNYYRNSNPLDVNGSTHCPRQVSEFKDCKFTRGECIDGKSKITIIEEAKYNGTCPTDETCTDCSWTACINNIRTKSIPPTNGGRPCPDISLIQTCNNCEVSTWSDCSNNKRTRTITKAATNGGTCNDILTELCNDCVGIWDKWTPCIANCDAIKTSDVTENYKNGYRTSTYKIIIPESNGGASCNIENGQIKIDNNCLKNCSCSEWSECDCITKTITRNCNGYIQTKNCSNNNCYYKKIFYYIINFFNLIILFITNLFR
jgi:hypothetical protein